MIKRELFQRYSKKIFIIFTALSMSVALNGCATKADVPAVAENVQTVEVKSDITDNNLADTVQAEEVETTESQDLEPPVIEVTNLRVEVLEGDPINLLEGVSALDSKDGDLTSAITASAVDEAILGAEQTIKYSVTDAAGNEATAEVTLLIKANPIEVLEKTMYATSAVNVRSGSNQETDKISSLGFAEAVSVTGKDKTTGWYQIKLADGSLGYVSDKYLSDTKPAPKPAATKPSSTQSKPSGGGTQSKPSNSGGSSSSSNQGSGNSNSSGSDRVVKEEKPPLDLNTAEWDKAREDAQKMMDEYGGIP